jgi:hypothetical protein
MQTYLCDKMPPKKVKIKKRKKMGLNKFRIQFFNFNFFGGILSLRQVCFFELSFKFSFFYTLYDLQYFKKKNVHLSEEPILKFINTKIKKR